MRQTGVSHIIEKVGGVIEEGFISNMVRLTRLTEEKQIKIHDTQERITMFGGITALVEIMFSWIFKATETLDWSLHAMIIPKTQTQTGLIFYLNRELIPQG